jgi:hypothetical protein
MEIKEIIVKYLKDLSSESLKEVEGFEFEWLKLMILLKLRSMKNVTIDNSKRGYDSSFLLFKEKKIRLFFISSFIKEEKYNSILDSLKSTGDEFFVINFIEANLISNKTFLILKERDQICFVFSKLKCFLLNDSNSLDFKGDFDQITSALQDPPLGKEITFVFTDIVNSCSLWIKNHNTMKRIISEYFKKIRFMGITGYEVKTIGDSIFFVFGDVKLSLQFCLQTQEMFQNNSWKEELKDLDSLNLKNKMGFIQENYDSIEFNLSTGKFDYFVRTINKTCRIVDKCPGDLIITDEYTFKICQEFKELNFESKNMNEIYLSGIGKSILYLIKPKNFKTSFPKKLKKNKEEEIDLLKINHLKEIDLLKISHSKEMDLLKINHLKEIELLKLEIDSLKLEMDLMKIIMNQLLGFK